MRESAPHCAFAQTTFHRQHYQERFAKDRKHTERFAPTSFIRWPRALHPLSVKVSTTSSVSTDSFESIWQQPKKGVPNPISYSTMHAVQCTKYNTLLVFSVSTESFESISGSNQRSTELHCLCIQYNAFCLFRVATNGNSLSCRELHAAQYRIERHRPVKCPVKSLKSLKCTEEYIGRCTSNRQQRT